MEASVAMTGTLVPQKSPAKQVTWEGVRPYNFGELAQLYYPDHPYDSALRLFREEMHLTRGLWDAMVAEGYKEKKKMLTRAQVKVIVKFLDPPI